MAYCKVMDVGEKFSRMQTEQVVLQCWNCSHVCIPCRGAGGVSWMRYGTCGGWEIPCCQNQLTCCFVIFSLMA